MNKIFAAKTNRNFIEVKKMTWLIFMELEKALKGNEICADRTLWNVLCEMSAPH